MTKQEYDAACKIRRAYRSYCLRATINARIMNRSEIRYGKERLKSSILKSLSMANKALNDVPVFNEGDGDTDYKEVAI